MHDVRERNCQGAWQEGVRLLRRSGGEVFNLITVIESPADLSPAWLVNHSPRLVQPGSDDIRDVIDTVFPYTLAQRYTPRDQFYREYMRRHGRAKRWRRNRGRWGTYFARLIDFDGRKNQLDIAIDKLRIWGRNTTGLVFHMSSPTLDSPRTRGGPCLQYAQLLWRQGDILDLVAVYRNHDFFNKAFGNFIALGQLLSFIAQESGKTAGSLICHSAHAYSEHSMGALGNLAQV